MLDVVKISVNHYYIFVERSIKFDYCLHDYLLLNGINTFLVFINVPFKKNPQISKRPSIFKIFVLMAKKLIG